MKVTIELSPEQAKLLRLSLFSLRARVCASPPSARWPAQPQELRALHEEIELQVLRQTPEPKA